MDTIALKAPGGFLTSRTKKWQMGNWTAASGFLDFSSKNSIIWRCDYFSIINLHFEKLPFSFGREESICIEYGSKNEKIWVIVKNLKKWRNFIYAHACPQLFFITEEEIYALVQKIDILSEEIVWYLWRNKHAALSELTRGIFNQSEVLGRIKNNINPKSEELYGFPFCVFRTEKKLINENKVITNSWWLYQSDSEEI